MSKDLSDEVIRLHELHLIHFMDDEGEEGVRWHWEGEPMSMQNALGLLETCKMVMWNTAYEDE